MRLVSLIVVIGLTTAIGGCHKHPPKPVVQEATTSPTDTPKGTIDPTWQIFTHCGATYVYLKPDGKYTMWNLDESNEKEGHWMDFAQGVDVKSFCEERTTDAN